MTRNSIAALALSFAICAPAAAGDPSQPTRMGEDKDKTVYVQLIVKACHRAEIPLEPTGHGKVYDNEKALTLDERKAALIALGCIDVPVPMEFLADLMSPSACMGHGGYLAAMQFLEQRQDLRDFPTVGAWQCVITDHEVVGASTM
ncbi:MAG: hypothetical protein ACRECX_12645 [Methyloceanibacter sp.]|uniref:hypothetical protein n=1 Tax=Methyloceanibacter sp. TaxID=1965321 RepID=UPI003D6CECEC